ncbi:MAG: AmmeMemoRadiSam system protein B [Candidatus Diapherotrites archaeon]
MTHREPAVCGQFYPADKEVLKETLEELFKGVNFEDKAHEAIVPHAGYRYSGKTAAKTVALLKKNKTFVVLSPNHTGIGCDIAISESNTWVTPLGNIRVNSNLAQKIAKSGIAEFDDSAHIAEHSIEVILPFLQYRFGAIDVVPITIATTDFNILKKFGLALSEISKKERFALIASSDFSHFVPEKYAKEKDLSAIRFIEKLDAKGFYDEVMGKNLSICGLAPITSLLEYCKNVNRKKGLLVEYTTSARATGDKSNVVGYAGIIFI